LIAVVNVQDQYDTIDLSDNELTKLENFPLLARLTGLLLNNNRITRCTDGLGQYLPKLATLILTNNRISSLEHLDPLAELTSLHTLSLLNNPVSKLPNYRLYVIFKLPSVKILDFAKIKPQVRADASSCKLFDHCSRFHARSTVPCMRIVGTRKLQKDLR